MAQELSKLTYSYKVEQGLANFPDITESEEYTYQM